jgi:hypothetical protein
VARAGQDKVQTDPALFINTSPQGRLCVVAKQVGELRFTVWIHYVWLPGTLNVLDRRVFARQRWFFLFCLFISLKTFPYVHKGWGWRLAKLVSARVEQANRLVRPRATTPKAPIRSNRRRKYSLAAAKQTVASQPHLCLQQNQHQYACNEKWAKITYI